MSTADPDDERRPDSDLPAWFRPPVHAPKDQGADDASLDGPTDADPEPEPGTDPEPDVDQRSTLLPAAEPEAAREPVELPEPPVTGDDAVDVALSELADVMTGSLEDQLAGYEQAHRVLQERLADVEG